MKTKTNLNTSHAAPTDGSCATKHERWEESSEEGESNQFSTSWK